MNLKCSILSLLLLSAYALLLLHDFIPHTHHAHKDDVQITSAVHHSHGDHHQHTDDHHDEGEKDDKSSESSDKNSDDHLIHTDSHSGYEDHRHDLVHRAFTRDKLISPVDADLQLLMNFPKLPDRLDNHNQWQSRSLPPPSDPHLSSGHGLRAPPVLG